MMTNKNIHLSQKTMSYIVTMTTKNTAILQPNISSTNVPIYESISYCSFNTTIEQQFQYQFFSQR